jgi:hypothetical protein
MTNFIRPLSNIQKSLETPQINQALTQDSLSSYKTYNNSVNPNLKPNLTYINNPPFTGLNMNSYLQSRDPALSQSNNSNQCYSNKIIAGFENNELQNLENSPTQNFQMNGPLGTERIPSERENSENFNTKSALYENTKQKLGEKAPPATYTGDQNLIVKNPKQPTNDDKIPLLVEREQISLQASVRDEQKANQDGYSNLVNPILQKVQSTPPNKMIKKVILKWISVEKGHQKIVKYQDGTTEQIAMAQQETDDYKNMNFANMQQNNSNLFNQNTSQVSSELPATPKNAESTYNPANLMWTQSLVTQEISLDVSSKSNRYSQSPVLDSQSKNLQGLNPMEKTSHIINYNLPNARPITNSMTNFDTKISKKLNFVLFPDTKMPPILLFRANEFKMSTMFREIACFVNKSNPVNPSMHHNVDDSFLQPTPKYPPLQISPFVPLPSSNHEEPV